MKPSEVFQERPGIDEADHLIVHKKICRLFSRHKLTAVDGLSVLMLLTVTLFMQETGCTLKEATEELSARLARIAEGMKM